MASVHQRRPASTPRANACIRSRALALIQRDRHAAQQPEWSVWASVTKNVERQDERVVRVTARQAQMTHAMRTHWMTRTANATTISSLSGSLPASFAGAPGLVGV